MKKILCLLATALIAVPVLAQNVGVSVSIGDPGFYGRLDIGDAPRPRILYRDPIVVERVQVREPIYMRVPPGHAKHWKKHCHEYNACGRPVYFVQNDWYNDVYSPYYRKQHGKHDRDDDRHEQGKGHGKDNGHGRGKNKGNGKGKNH